MRASQIVLAGCENTSRTDDQGSHVENAIVLTGSLADEVAALKARDGGDILIYGSASLVHAPVPLGLVDEYRLTVYPTVPGRGKRLFLEGVKTILSLAECRQLGSGIVLLQYVGST